MSDKSPSIKRIGVLTSGGDAPGMNAAIRAVVRVSIAKGIKITGIRSGYQGLLENKLENLEVHSVANLLQRGGTFLKTARCLDFHKPEVRALAAKNLRAAQIDALICIGGDGTFRGAQALYQEYKIDVVGIPGTIDNDIYGTDRSIGFDTAVNTALDAIDRIRDTAASHDRLFIVEVMGRDSGFIAVEVGLAGGAEEVFIPDSPLAIDQVIRHIQRGIERGKNSSILVAAEGQKPGRAYDLAEALRKKAGYEAKVCILGHIQRGGAPTASDRVLASRLGAAAVQALLHGHAGGMIAIQNDATVFVPFDQCLGKKKTVSNDLIDLARTLAI